MDPSYLIFHENKKDFSETSLSKENTYETDFFGTRDAYSYNESQDEDLRSGVNQAYSSCKKLFLRVLLVLKNKNGQNLVETPVSQIASLFNK